MAILALPDPDQTLAIKNMVMIIISSSAASEDDVITKLVSMQFDKTKVIETIDAMVSNGEIKRIEDKP